MNPHAKDLLRRAEAANWPPVVSSGMAIANESAWRRELALPLPAILEALARQLDDIETAASRPPLPLDDRHQDREEADTATDDVERMVDDDPRGYDGSPLRLDVEELRRQRADLLRKAEDLGGKDCAEFKDDQAREAFDAALVEVDELNNRMAIIDPREDR